MSRGPRLDAPGVLHHGMVRGRERTALVRGRLDRDACVRGPATGVQVGGAPVYAWALLATHVHLRVRTDRGPPRGALRAALRVPAAPPS